MYPYSYPPSPPTLFYVCILLFLRFLIPSLLIPHLFSFRPLLISFFSFALSSSSSPCLSPSALFFCYPFFNLYLSSTIFFFPFYFPLSYSFNVLPIFLLYFPLLLLPIFIYFSFFLLLVRLLPLVVSLCPNYYLLSLIFQLCSSSCVALTTFFLFFAFWCTCCHLHLIFAFLLLIKARCFSNILTALSSAFPF